MSKELGDFVKITPQDEIPRNLFDLAKKLNTLAAFIADGIPRTNERVVLANLGKHSAIQLERLASFYPSTIEGVAWCTRNLFELNLIVRFVMMDPKNFELWSGQVAGDEMQIIEGMLGLVNDSNKSHVATLRNRLVEIKNICKRHGIDPSKPFQISQLAKAVNRSVID